jgi:hypothetical protein
MRRMRSGTGAIATPKVVRRPGAGSAAARAGEALEERPDSGPIASASATSALINIVISANE